MCAKSIVKGRDESRRLHVGYGGFFAVGVFAVVFIISASAMPSWDFNTNSLFDFVDGTDGFGEFYVIGSVVSMLGVAVFSLRLTGRKLCAMETLAGVMMLMVLILLVSAAVTDARGSVSELFQKLGVGMMMVTMVSMFVCNQFGRRVLAGGLTLMLLAVSLSAFYFKDLAYAYNVAMICFSIFLIIQNASLLAKPKGGAE